MDVLWRIELIAARVITSMIFANLNWRKYSRRHGYVRHVDDTSYKVKLERYTNGLIYCLLVIPRPAAYSASNWAH